MSDEDDLYRYYDRMDERRRAEEAQYNQQKRAELDAAWLHGIESRDYSEFYLKLGIDPPTGCNSASLEVLERLPIRCTGLAAVSFGDGHLPVVCTVHASGNRYR